MKKILLALAFVMALAMSSCSTIRHSATVLPVVTDISSSSTADLQVSHNKISYKYFPTKAVSRGGYHNILCTAVAEALKNSGNADLLVAPQYEIKTTTNFFGRRKVNYVVIEGYPARYINVKPATSEAESL